LEVCTSLPGSFGEWTSEQQEAALHALRSLATGDGVLLHPDVRAENFMLSSSGQVVVIDLESSSKLLQSDDTFQATLDAYMASAYNEICGGGE
jgi:serine/threonine protein kinase